MKKLATASIIAASLVLTMSACSPDEGPPSSTPSATRPAAQGPAPVVADPNPMPDAVARATAFTSPNPLAEQARAKVTNECMVAQGINYQTEADIPKDFFVYLLTPQMTVQQAMDRGYPESLSQPETPIPEGVSEAVFREALYGPDDAQKVKAGLDEPVYEMSSVGCSAEGYKAVYGTLEDGMLATGVAQSSAMNIVKVVNKDEALRAADQEWAACMADTPYSNEQSPAGAYMGQKQNPVPGNDLAIADASCRESTGYEAKLAAVIGKYASSFLRSYEPQIARVQEIREAAAENARTILS